VAGKKKVFDVSIKYSNLKDSSYQKDDWRVVGKAYQEPDGKIIIMMGGTPFPGWDGSMVLFPYGEAKES
jgi:hypothetical protein